MILPDLLLNKTEGWERIQIIMNREGMNKNSFSKAIGLSSNVTIGRIINEKRQPSKSTCIKIVEKFPYYNLEWISNGNGSMLNDKDFNEDPAIIDSESSADQIKYPYIINVRLVNQYAYAGYLTGFSDMEYIESLPTIPFITDQEAHGNYMAFEVKGDSMNDGTEDSYLEGDRLLCREISPELWSNYKLHIRKWDFVIIHRNGIYVKKIVEHNVEEHKIRVHSLNTLYEDKEIDLMDVRQIFNVIELQRPKRR